MVNISTSNIKPWGSWDKEVQQRTSAFLGSLVDITANAAADIFNPNPFIDFSGGKNAWFKKIIEDSWSSLSNTQVVTPSETKPPQNISSETKSPSVTDVDKVSNALKGKGMSLVSMIVLDKEGKQVSSTASQKIGGDSDSSVASLMKMPIALAYIDLVKDGKIKNPDKQSLSLMLEKSDNKAANKIIDQVKSLLPAGDDPYKLFNDKFKELGFSNTILRRKFDDPVVSDATGKPIKNESTTADLAKAMNTLTSQSSSSADVDPLYKAAQKALAEASKAHGFLSSVAGNKEVQYSKYAGVGSLTALSLKMKNGETVVIYAKSNNSLEKEPEVTVAFNSMMAAIGQR